MTLIRIPGQKDGRLSWCKTCQGVLSKAWSKKHYAEDPKEAIKKSREWRLANPDKYRDTKKRYSKNNAEKIRVEKRNRNLKSKYGITSQEFDDMAKAQGGCCAICRQPPSGRWRRLVVDHCHSSGRVRGLLCNQCNRALGFLGDDQETLDRAASYLNGSLAPGFSSDRLCLLNTSQRGLKRQHHELLGNPNLKADSPIPTHLLHTTTAPNPSRPTGYPPDNYEVFSTVLKLVSVPTKEHNEVRTLLLVSSRLLSHT